jgi:hypothetical protein
MATDGDSSHVGHNVERNEGNLSMSSAVQVGAAYPSHLSALHSLVTFQGYGEISGAWRMGAQQSLPQMAIEIQADLP